MDAGIDIKHAHLFVPADGNAFGDLPIDSYVPYDLQSAFQFDCTCQVGSENDGIICSARAKSFTQRTVGVTDAVIGIGQPGNGKY